MKGKRLREGGKNQEKDGGKRENRERKDRLASRIKK